MGTFAIAAAICLAIGFLLGSWFFLKDAEKKVADQDRTRHWRDEPRRLRRSGRRTRILDALPVEE